MYENVLMFQPRRDTTVAPNRCTCNELTAGLCVYCVMLPSYKPEPPVSVELKVTIDGITMERALRGALADLLRKFADQEAGPVGIRLRQIAAVFEEAA